MYLKQLAKTVRMIGWKDIDLGMERKVHENHGSFVGLFSGQ